MVAAALLALMASPVRVPAAYVLDAQGRPAYAVGYPGSVGRTCRGDLLDSGRPFVCTAESVNPLQAAVDWASAHRMRDVRLDAAEYTFDTPQASHTGRIGFFIPSGIHLRGVMRGGEPASVLTPSTRVETTVEVRARGDQLFDVLVLPSGSRTDRAVPLVDTTIEAVQLNNRYIGGVCLWSSGGSRFRLLRVHSMGSRQSSLIIGHYDPDREDPRVRYRGAIYGSSDFEVGWCHVQGANGDGICVIGQRGLVHDNLCENGASTFDNGLTTFIGSSDIRFIHNRIVNFPTAIGLDGTFLAARRLPGLGDPAAAEAESRRRQWDLYRGREGYHRHHEIGGNTIRNCRRGIVLWRTEGIDIHHNTLEGRGILEAFSLEESSRCRVWANRAWGWSIGCRLYAHSDSALAPPGQHEGTSDNRIGGPRGGNDLRGNDVGVAFVRATADARIRRNVLIGNDCRGCDSPLVTEGAEAEAATCTLSGNLPPSINVRRWLPPRL